MRKLILVAFIFAGCSKSPESTTPVTVLESVTNSPVSGADLALFTSVWGGALGSTLFQGVTDANGVCKVPSEDYNKSDGMNVTKAKYWPFEVQKNTTVYITPEGWIRVQIHQVGSYPAGSKLLFEIANQIKTRSESGYYDAAPDGFILLKGYGGQQNSIHYRVVDGAHNLIVDGSTVDLSIPRFDTLKNIVLNY